MLEDENIFTCRREYANEHKKILNDISKQELYISKARKYLLDEKIDFDDFSKLKKEHNEKLCELNSLLNGITQKLSSHDPDNILSPACKLLMIDAPTGFRTGIKIMSAAG